jgi:hypothetical protein
VINEQEKRRPDVFRGECPVVLADGQIWWLPKPRARFALDAGASGVNVVVSLPGSDTYGELFQKAKNAELAEVAVEEGNQTTYAGPSVLACYLALARHLITFNYDLSPAELGDILQFSYDDDDEEGCRIRREVLAVVSGRAPKHQALEVASVE